MYPCVENCDHPRSDHSGSEEKALRKAAHANNTYPHERQGTLNFADDPAQVLRWLTSKAVRERLHFDETSGVNWFKEILVKDWLGSCAQSARFAGSDVAG